MTTWITVKDAAVLAGVGEAAIRRAYRERHLAGRPDPADRRRLLIDAASVKARYHPQRTCPTCHTPIPPGRTRRHYCNSACLSLAGSRRVLGLPIDFTGHQRVCAHCGRSYVAHTRWGRYCQTACRVRAWKERQVAA